MTLLVFTKERYISQTLQILLIFTFFNFHKTSALAGLTFRNLILPPLSITSNKFPSTLKSLSLPREAKGPRLVIFHISFINSFEKG